MQSPETTVPPHDSTPPAAPPSGPVVPDFSGTPVPIGQLTEHPEWPLNALGTFVTIHGFEGVVVDIIGQSIKVLSSERITQRFNANRLKTLFAPPDRSKPVSSYEPPKPVAAPVQVPVATATEPESEPELPKRIHITEPDFTQELRAIRTYAAENDFPQCAYGKHVDISGFSGVVVEIVRGSLKVLDQEGTLRSYNAVALRKLYGR